MSHFFRARCLRNVLICFILRDAGFVRSQDESRLLKCAPALALSLLPRQPQPIVLADRFNAEFGRLRQF